MPSTCGASLMKQTYRPRRTPARSFPWNTHVDGLSINLFGSTRRLHHPEPTTTVPGMRVAMMTREYPPEVYGGAGVHVTELVAQLRKLCQVDVHCMGAPRAGAFAYQPDSQLRGANPALSTLSSDLVMANPAADATVVHTHTWYTGLAGQTG